MKYIDLHLHSFYSDGEFSPKELIFRLKKENISKASLTDHNTIKGVGEIMEHGKKEGIKIITGVELYTKFKGKNLHLLGYNFDLENEEINILLNKAQKHHLCWVYQTIKKLEGLGFKINYTTLNAFKTKYLGFRHLSDLLFENKENKKKILRRIKYWSLFDLINHYFVPGKPAFIPHVNMNISTSLAIKIIKKAGGVSVLAHPGQQLIWGNDPMIIALKKQGLNGLEVITPYHNWHQVEHYQILAEQLSLFMTGGSDYHGDLKIGKPIKNAWNYLKIPSFLYKNIL